VKPPVILRIYLNGQLHHTTQHTADQIVIGNNDEAHVQLKDTAIAAVHAVIDERDAGYYVSDLGSQTGTFRNGQRVSDEKLQSGDELQVGPYRIEFFIGIPKPTQAPHPTPAAPKASAPEAERPPDVAVKSQRKSDAPAAQPKGKAAAPSAVGAVVVAPSSTFAGGLVDQNARMKKSRGPAVEVVVVWRDRVLGTYQFSGKREVSIGSSSKNSIVVPLLGLTKNEHHLLSVTSAGVRVHLTADMAGDYFKDEERLHISDLKRKNRVVQEGSGFALDLAQGEAVRVTLHGELLSVYVRYVPETASPIAAPILDFTASESTAVLMSFVIAAIFGLYMLIYSPKPPEEEALAEQPIRKATVTFNVPKKPVVEVSEEPKQKQIVKVSMDEAVRQTTKSDPGQAAELRPSATNKKSAAASSTIKQGGTVNTGKAAAGAQSETRDVTKIGLLSTFGGKGTQNQLSKAYSGSGELVGDAAKATGYSGSAEDRAGESLGGRLKNIGAGGKGTATYGIAGVGTQGKGTGTFGSGTGGIGKRGRVDLNIGESDAEFSGSIDREAIRRVIRENLKLFENCYNQALRRNSDAYGKVEITWNIEERGRATKAFVKSNSVGDKPMGECIARVIRGLTFPEPPPDQVAQVTYPFVFASQ
jgi:hypothetical protein